MPSILNGARAGALCRLSAVFRVASISGVFAPRIFLFNLHKPDPESLYTLPIEILVWRVYTVFTR